METIYKIPLVFESQPEGGFTVTSPLLPELITEGDTLEEVMENVKDALRAVLELYEDMGRTIPPVLQQASDETRFLLESAIAI